MAEEAFQTAAPSTFHDQLVQWLQDRLSVTMQERAAEKVPAAATLLHPANGRLWGDSELAEAMQ